MTQRSTLLATSALLSAAATGAFADLTAAETWDSYKSLMGVYGQLTATEKLSGDVLEISGITLFSDVEGARSLTELDGTITFREQGDGTVAIELPATLGITSGVKAEDADAVALNMSMTQQGMTIIASGTADNITHAISAPSLTYALGDINVDGQPVKGDLNIAMTEMNGTWVSSGSTARRYTSDYTIAGMTIKGQFAEPGTPNQFAIDATMNDLAATSDGTVPEGLAELPPEQIFTSGFGMNADMTYGPVTYAMQVTAEGQTTNVNGTIESGTFGVGMDGDAIRYQTSSQAMDVSGAIPGLPFPPVEVHMDSSSFDFAMPIGKTDEAQDFGLGIALKGFTVSDFLWAMVDPAQQLPRDPANVVVDMDGKANWLVNIFDETAMANAGPGAGKIESLTLKELEVTVAGASLTGDGSFTFDNTDLQTFNGIPRPMGAINLAMSGGITLLDKLTSMNLIPQQQAMGIKMMSGLFAKPGNGPDTLTSTIEIDPSGSILANGQKIQ